MDTKAFWKSKGFWGIVFSIIGKISSVVFGIDYLEGIDTEAVSGQLEVALNNADAIYSVGSLALSFAGDILAMVGRSKATAPLALK